MISRDDRLYLTYLALAIAEATEDVPAEEPPRESQVAIGLVPGGPKPPPVPGELWNYLQDVAVHLEAFGLRPGGPKPPPPPMEIWDYLHQVVDDLRAGARLRTP